MQVFFALIETVAGSYVRGIRFLILGGIALAAIFFLFLGYAAPVVVDKVGERAESIGDKAIAAAREEQRAAAMAGEGWGYSADSGASESSFAPETTATYDAAYDDTYDESYGEPAEDWGEPTE